MTDQDRQYMVDVDDPNLAAFLRWHDKARSGALQGVSWYSQLKMAFMAGKNSQRSPELAPSRDVLPPAPREMPARRRSLDPEFELRVPQRPDRGFSTATVPGARAMNWPQRTPEDHREAQRYVETQAMPALPPDPFARVRLSGPQEAALDSLYPEPGFQTMEFPVVGAVESVSEHRRQQMEARYAGLSDFGPRGPVMTPLQALPEPGDGS